MGEVMVGHFLIATGDLGDKRFHEVMGDGEVRDQPSVFEDEQCHIDELSARVLVALEGEGLEVLAWKTSRHE